MPDGRSEALSCLRGRSAAMERLREDIARVAPTALSIHVHGETGTGKELVARAIHALSGRAGRYVPFNAAWYSDDLIVPELFGHARGAFTGATGSREGRVADAEGGTLFIDEIADLSERAQTKLLRFLEEKEYSRLGEGLVRRADVRVVSATHRDIEERVRQRRFREDLWYRVKDHRVLVPPLRERGGDALDLARHFLSRARCDPPPGLSREAAAAIARYRWPGNVRQLAREMERAAVMAEHGVVHARHLSPEVLEPSSAVATTLRAARLEFDRTFVGRVLARHRGARAAAAAELGISRQGLFTLIRRLGLDTE